MKIFFRVHFKTSYGQNLFIVGDCKELGNNQKNEAIPLSYINPTEWGVTVEINSKNFTYSYFLTDENTGKIIEEWQGRTINLNEFYSDTLLLNDFWNYPNLPEFNLSTELFKCVGDKVSKDKTESNKDKTHLFSIKAPLLDEHLKLCLLGNVDELSNWDIKNPIVMSHRGNGLWEKALDLSRVKENIIYKYGIYDTKNKSFVSYELGDNRMTFPTHKNVFQRIQDVNFITDNKWRGSGVAIPVFSIRTQEGLGVGEFLDLIPYGEWAKEAGLSMIQILPIHDTTARHTWWDCYPYAAISVYALHPMYLRLTELPYQFSEAQLKEIEEKKNALNQLEVVDYEQVNQFKIKKVDELFQKHSKQIIKNQHFQQFLNENEEWLKTYAVFCTLRDKHGDVNFYHWGGYKDPNKEMIEAFFNAKHEDYLTVIKHSFIQWQLHEQLSKAVEQLHQMNIALKGDLPIGIYRYSADAWSQRELFHMDQQAGAPPDDFAVLGQNWEFPTYNWERMKGDHFAWWKSRFNFMSKYFDAFRIDHILGFFRIWQIPMSATQGILGRFEPALPVTIDELYARGLWWDEDRMIKPYLPGMLLDQYFGHETPDVIKTYFEHIGDSHFKFKEEFNTQRKVVDSDKVEEAYRDRLLELLANVLFIKEENSETIKLHPRYGMEQTNSFKWLDGDSQNKLKVLYNDYFYHRQEDFWKEKGLEKLPYLKKATEMLTCGEDLGMVPKMVPGVMHDLAILSLQIQRMPSQTNMRYSHPARAPYLCVVSPSSHDTSTLRQWWEEDKENTQYYFNHILGRYGVAPSQLSPDLAYAIVEQHVYSPAMLTVIPMQDLFAMHGDTVNPNLNIERINIPAIFPHYWQYRMHISVEDLLNNDGFTHTINNLNKRAGRGVV